MNVPLFRYFSNATSDWKSRRVRLTVSFSQVCQSGLSLFSIFHRKWWLRLLAHLLAYVALLEKHNIFIGRWVLPFIILFLLLELSQNPTIIPFR